MMKTPKVPQIEGVTQLTLLQMNGVTFDKKHTLLTPELLESLNKKDSKSDS